MVDTNRRRYLIDVISRRLEALRGEQLVCLSRLAEICMESGRLLSDLRDVFDSRNLDSHFAHYSTQWAATGRN